MQLGSEKKESKRTEGELKADGGKKRESTEGGK